MPTNVHPNPKPDNTVAAQFVERIEGETTFDQIAKAQSSMPQVVKRITELENGLWALAEELTKFDPRNPQVECAKLLLKNRLEILDSSEPLRVMTGEKRNDESDFLASLWREVNSFTNAEPESGKPREDRREQTGSESFPYKD
jgi:hypothetical protein